MSVRKDSFAWLGVGIIVVGVLAAGIFFMREQYDTTTIRLGDGVFSARIVATDAAQRKGLGGVAELPEQQAMLFVYETDQVNDIWMKDMKIPIDVVWLDSTKKVVYIETSMQPDSYPKTYGPAVRTRYIIEFAEGTVAKKGIKLGAKAAFELKTEGKR